MLSELEILETSQIFTDSSPLTTYFRRRYQIDAV